MDFLYVIGVIIFWVFLGQILNAVLKTFKAAGKAAIGKGTLSENFEDEFKGMGDLRIRISDKKLGDEADGGTFKSIEAKGTFPVSSKTRLGVIASIFTEVDGELTPVISAIDAFQEPESSVFQWAQEVGDCEAGWGFSTWVQFAPVPPQYLIPAYSGNRKVQVFIRLVDLDNPPSITHGFHPGNHSGLVWQQSIDFYYNFQEKGYREAHEDKDKARTFAIKLGVAVAMADGNLDEKEGNVLKHWIKKTIEPYEGERRETLKELYNTALRDSYQQAQSGTLSLSELASELEKIGESAEKYEAIELCFEVMAADGVADPQELKTIHAIADALELDYYEIERLRDQKLVGLAGAVGKNTSLEDILGIDSSWSNDQIKKHLRVEFKKWNGRLNGLDAGPDRESAQSMLDSIAEARKKYG